VIPNCPKRTVAVGRVTKNMGSRFIKRAFRGTPVYVPARASPLYYSAALAKMRADDTDGFIPFGDDGVYHFAGEGDRFHSVDIASMDAHFNVTATAVFNDQLEAGLRTRGCTVAAQWDNACVDALLANEGTIRVRFDGGRWDGQGFNPSGDGETWLKNTIVAANIGVFAFSLPRDRPSEEILARAYAAAGFSIECTTSPLANVIFCQMVNFPCAEFVPNIPGFRSSVLITNCFAPNPVRMVVRSVTDEFRGERARDDLAATAASLQGLWCFLPFLQPLLDFWAAQGSAELGVSSIRHVAPADMPSADPYAEEFFSSMLGIDVLTTREFFGALGRAGRLTGALHVSGVFYQACVDWVAEPATVWV